MDPRQSSTSALRDGPHCERAGTPPGSRHALIPTTCTALRAPSAALTRTPSGAARGGNPQGALTRPASLRALTPRAPAPSLTQGEERQLRVVQVVLAPRRAPGSLLRTKSSRRDSAAVPASRRSPGRGGGGGGPGPGPGAGAAPADVALPQGRQRGHRDGLESRQGCHPARRRRRPGQQEQEQERRRRLEAEPQPPPEPRAGAGAALAPAAAMAGAAAGRRRRRRKQKRRRRTPKRTPAPELRSRGSRSPAAPSSGLRLPTGPVRPAAPPPGPRRPPLSLALPPAQTRSVSVLRPASQIPVDPPRPRLSQDPLIRPAQYS